MKSASNRWFVDTPLEQSGFEPLVPPASMGSIVWSRTCLLVSRDGPKFARLTAGASGLEPLVPVSAAGPRKVRRVQTDSDQMAEQGGEPLAIGLGQWRLEERGNIGAKMLGVTGAE